MARPKGKKPPMKAISFMVPLEMIEEVERISIKRDAEKAKVYRMLIDLGIQCHKDMEKVGLIGVVDFTHYVKKALEEKFKKSGPKQLNLL